MSFHMIRSFLIILSISFLKIFHCKNDFFTNKNFPLPYSSKYFASSDGLIRVARPVSWIDCGNSDDLFRLDSLILSPDPPKRSAPLTVHLKGQLKETLTEGVVNYAIRFGGFTLATGSLDGCPSLEKESTLPHCPVEKGIIDVTHTVQIPWQIPPGRYFIDAHGERSVDHKQIFCLNLDVAIDLVSD